MPEIQITKADLVLADKARRKLESRELAADFSKFFRAAWKVLNPSVPLSESFHYDYLCEVLTYAASGQMKKDHPEFRGVIINVPPRTLKSFMCTIAFPDFVWTKHPETKFLCLSYGSELSVNELGTKRRKLLADEWYRDRWPKTQMVQNVDLKHRWDSTAGGYMIATTPGGFASGAGGNIIVIDDILKLDDAYTTFRENANSYYEQELYSRLNNQAEDFFVVICQRLHEMDLPGYLLAKEPGLWWHVVIPLECEEDTEYVFPISGKKYIRKKGDILLPDRFPPHAVKALKQSSIRYAGQYQQSPMPATGALCNPNWWMYYESDENGKPTEDLPSFEQVIVSVDCAFKGTQKSDFVCLQKWGFVKNSAYLLELINERLDFVGTESAILSMISHGFRTDVLLVEEAANGAAIISSLKRKSLPVTIVPITAEGGKLSRAMAAQPEVETGNCVIPKNAPWLADFKRQLALGPLLTDNDDMIDAWSQVLNWRKQHRYGFFESLASRRENKIVEAKSEAKQIETPEQAAARRSKENRDLVRREFQNKLGRTLRRF